MPKSKSYEIDMCSGPILKKMLYFALPLMCSGVLQLLFNAADIIVVGRYAGDNSMYAELNTKSDYCQVCGFDGEISIVEDDGKLVWECPKCGNRDQNQLNVARRTCGYIGTQFWNQGRTQEIQERVLHL